MSMKDFKKERGRGRQYARMAGGSAGLLVLGFVAAGSGQAAWGMYQKFAEASSANAAAQSELVAIQGQYAAAQVSVEGLETDRGLEAVVRERYGVGRPGEGEIDIVRQASTSAAGASEPQNIFERLWHALFVW